jgi:beta-N-acetylhexosaminidase
MMERAMLAGNHLAMICHRVHLIAEARSALEKADRAALDNAVAAVNRFKGKLASPKPFTEERFLALDQEVLQLRIATLGADAAALRSPEDGKRSPVETY